MCLSLKVLIEQMSVSNHFKKVVRIWKMCT